jgi:hypothetical protein
MLFNKSGRYKWISEHTRLRGPAGIQTLLHQKCWEKLNIWINVFDRRYGHSLRVWMKSSFKNQARATDSEHCDQSWLRPIQPLRAGFSTASARGEETHWAKCVYGQSVQPECSTDGVPRTSYICLPFPAFQMLAYWQPFLPSGSSSNIMNVLILLEAILR